MAKTLQVQRIIEQPLIITMGNNVIHLGSQRVHATLQALSAEGQHGKLLPAQRLPLTGAVQARSFFPVFH